jgi:hypothetical protein
VGSSAVTAPRGLASSFSPCIGAPLGGHGEEDEELLIFFKKILKHFHKMLINILTKNIGENILEKYWI